MESQVATLSGWRVRGALQHPRCISYRLESAAEFLFRFHERVRKNAGGVSLLFFNILSISFFHQIDRAIYRVSIVQRNDLIYRV